MVALDDLKYLFHPTCFYDSVIYLFFAKAQLIRDYYTTSDLFSYCLYTPESVYISVPTELLGATRMTYTMVNFWRFFFFSFCIALSLLVYELFIVGTDPWIRQTLQCLKSFLFSYPWMKKLKFSTLKIRRKFDIKLCIFLPIL